MKLQRKTNQLVIRAITKDDYEAWKTAFQILGDKPRNAWDAIKKDDSVLTKPHFNKMLKDRKKLWGADSFYHFGIFLKDGTYIGGVSLMDLTRDLFQNAYLGYRILNNHWGKGYGKEAATAAIEIAFKDLKLHRVEAGIEPKNQRSKALARSVGMRREGHSRKRIFINNTWIDSDIFAITTEDVGIKWKPQKPTKK